MGQNDQIENIHPIPIQYFEYQTQNLNFFWLEDRELNNLSKNNIGLCLKQLFFQLKKS